MSGQIRSHQPFVEEIPDAGLTGLVKSCWPDLNTKAHRGSTDQRQISAIPGATCRTECTIHSDAPSTARRRFANCRVACRTLMDEPDRTISSPRTRYRTRVMHATDLFEQHRLLQLLCPLFNFCQKVNNKGNVNSSPSQDSAAPTWQQRKIHRSGTASRLAWRVRDCSDSY